MGAWYATREDVKTALDYKETARNNAQIDRAIEAATSAIEDDVNLMSLWPVVATRYFDWPNFQRARAWRLWLDENTLISVTSLTSGGTVIPASGYFLEPVNSGPPYRSIEINIGTQSAFSSGASYQRSIAVAGLWGHSDNEAPAGTATAAATNTVTTINVSDSASIGVGQLLRIGAERLVVTEKTALTTGLTQQNALSALASDNQIQLTAGNGATFTIGEVITLGAERMRIVDIPGDTLTVTRAWDGSTLAAHTGATIYAPRQCTVTRAYGGTTAAAISQGAAIVKWVCPALARNLAIAYAENTLLMEPAGYVRASASASGSQRATSTVTANIADLTAKVLRAYGRQARMAAV